MVAGGAALLLALGFFLPYAWAKNLWPLPDSRLSYAFMPSILSGTAVPLIWVGRGLSVAKTCVTLVLTVLSPPVHHKFQWQNPYASAD